MTTRTSRPPLCVLGVTAALTALLLGCLSAGAAEPRTLVDAGRSAYEIVCAPDANAATNLAATELQEWVRRATGVKLPIVAQPTADKGHVFVGPQWLPRVGLAPAELPAEGFRIKTAGRDIYIGGADVVRGTLKPKRSSATQCGTLSGVYEFVERCLDVLFAWHDELGTIVPPRPSVVVPDLDLAAAPAWTYRALPYGPSGATSDIFGRRLRLGNSLTVSHSHAWMSILPIEKYGQEHPEYYAEINGRRAPKYYLGQHGGQVCTTNPQVIEIFAQAASAFFRAHPDRDMFSVSPNDGGGFCTCARCRALDVEADGDEPGQPSLTDRLLTFYNAIAERVAKDYPDKLLGAYIYSYYKRPPRRVRPHPNLALVHATNSAHHQGLNWDEERKWEQAWLALSKHVFKYDIYYYGDSSLHLIAPVTRHLVEKIKAEQAAGIRGGYLYIGQSYEQLGAGHYLLARLMWDKDADAAALERRYYDALYGPAGADVAAYYRLLEERLRRVYLQGIDVAEPAVAAARRLRPGATSPAYVLAAYWPILDQATVLVDNARRRTLSDAQQQRLTRLVDQHELLLSTVRGMILAGRLANRVEADAAEAARFVAAVDQRAAVRQRLRAYAPTLCESLDQSDKKDLLTLAPDGPMYLLAKAWQKGVPADARRSSTGGFQYGSFDDVPAADAAARLRFSGEGQAALTLVRDKVFGGRQAARVVVPDGGSASLTFTAAVRPDACYRALIAHCNRPSATKSDKPLIAPRTRIIFRDKKGKAVTPTAGYSWHGAVADELPDQWRELPHLFRTPAGTTQISLTLFLQVPGEYWLDEIRLEELGPASQ